MCAIFCYAYVELKVVQSPQVSPCNGAQFTTVYGLLPYRLNNEECAFFLQSPVDFSVGMNIILSSSVSCVGDAMTRLLNVFM